jgi:hypothetical protein
VFGLGGRATPGPVFSSGDQAGVQRVVQDVVDRRRELSIVPDHPRPEALGEERAEPAVAGVVLSSVVAVQPLHRLRELLRGAVHDEVVVGGHQAPGFEAQAEAPDRGAELEQEQAAVEVVPEERRFADAARGDVEVPVGQTRAQHSSHGPTMRPGNDRTQPHEPLSPHFRHAFASHDRCQTPVMARPGLALAG